MTSTQFVLSIEEKSIYQYPIYCFIVFIVLTTLITLIGNGLNQPHAALAQQQQPQVNLTSTEQQHLLDGISFQIDNVTFSHHMATVNGTQIHYIIGGHGDPVVLLH